jgi:DNA-binding transcriptional ArsR family regulator
MAKTERARKVALAECACLPEVMPEDVQLVLDRDGGVKGLLALLPRASVLEAEASVHKALSDPLRLRIMHLLARSPLCVCVVRAAMGVPDSKLSYHLGMLRSAGLASSNKRGNWIIYELTDDGRRWLEARSA